MIKIKVLQHQSSSSPLTLLHVCYITEFHSLYNTRIYDQYTELASVMIITAVRIHLHCHCWRRMWCRMYHPLSSLALSTHQSTVSLTSGLLACHWVGLIRFVDTQEGRRVVRIDWLSSLSFWYTGHTSSSAAAWWSSSSRRRKIVAVAMLPYLVKRCWHNISVKSYSSIGR